MQTDRQTDKVSVIRIHFMHVLQRTHSNKYEFNYCTHDTQKNIQQTQRNNIHSNLIKRKLFKPKLLCQVHQTHLCHMRSGHLQSSQAVCITSFYSGVCSLINMICCAKIQEQFGNVGYPMKDMQKKKKNVGCSHVPHFHVYRTEHIHSPQQLHLSSLIICLLDSDMQKIILSKLDTSYN
jgi:hypothetical protein